MSDSLTAGEPVAMIKVGARRGDSGGKPRMAAKFLLIGAVLPALLVGNLAMAQVDEPFDGTVTPTPMMGATSPLGITTGSTSSPTGIPFGATEITSPGLSPLPTGVTGTITIPTTGSGTACSTTATPPSEMFGSTASFDGGGMAVGTAAPATASSSGTTAMSTSSTSATSPSSTSMTSAMPTSSAPSGMLDTSGMSGMCGSGSSSLAASSPPTSTSPTTAGGAPRTGIPLASFEIGNLGVSSTPAVPLPSALPIAGAMAPSSSVPVMPTVSPMASSTTTSSNPACASPGTVIGPLSFAGEGNAGVTGASMAARMLRQSILCQRP